MFRKKPEINEEIKSEAPARSEGKKSFIQLIKFCIVGVANTLVSMIVQIIVSNILKLFWSGSWIDTAALILGHICGIINSYIMNSKWTFKEEHKRSKKELFRFILVNVLGLFITIGLREFFARVCCLEAWWNNVEAFGFFKKFIDGHLFCQLLATVCYIFVNFILNKVFVFKEKEDDKKAE